jgi:hypothetical protein
MNHAPEISSLQPLSAPTRRIDMARIAWMRAATVAAALLVGVIAVSAQDQSKLPDWSGQWMRGPGMGTGWDGTKEQGLGQQAPLTAEYRAKFERFLADKAAGGIGGDMTAICYPHGMPRMMIAIYPIEFHYHSAVTYILTDYTTHRRIYTDGAIGRKRYCRATTAIRSENGSTRMATAATTCSRSRLAASRVPARTKAAGCPCMKTTPRHPRADRI